MTVTVPNHGLVLVLNCGSSSIKYQLIDTRVDEPLAVGLIERVTDHATGVAEVIATLEGNPQISLTELAVVGHRVVQGGDEFTAPTIIDNDVERSIVKLAALAPLHNPGHAAGIRAAREAFPTIPHVAIFDTAFHQTMPPEAYTYALDRRVADEHAIRRYGFHGTSHGFVSRATADAMGADVRQINQIVLHLGNGASACAVAGGRSVDTSMGLTPLEGLVMGTRTGDIDPAVVAHLGRAAGMTIDEIDDLLNKHSGMLGLTGYNDMRDVHAAAEAGDHAAKLGLQIYYRRIRGYVGRYYAILGHLDSITFTAGVGENDDLVRLNSLAGLEELGIVIDAERNAGRKKAPTLISSDDSRVQVWVIPTNEEREIAVQSLAAIA
ncbi:acetate/propionate family kinase [Demequina sp.]|uniref:acetate/propionate family kinase n=1 Tax=Demequina sp. TaxID=2050685 RepID=UPI003D120A0B